MDFEELAKSPCKRTFPTFFQLTIKTRQTHTNSVSGAGEDLTNFGVPVDLISMSVDYFAAMVLLASRQVVIASLKHPEFGMTDTSLNKSNLEDFSHNQVLSNVCPFICNKIF